MAINKTVRKVIKALSYSSIDVETSRQLANLKAIDPIKFFHTALNAEVYNGDYKVPVRIYFPKEDVLGKTTKEGVELPTMIFFHGGGWVTERIDNYERVCAGMANATGQVVISVEYRLAPEYPFPIGLTDCYAVTEAVYKDKFLLNISPDQITIIGDSAGGNLAAALSLMARDKGDFLPKRQILIYPAVNSDYSENSKFASVKENGSDYLLTAGKLRDYIDLYAGNEDDKTNPYFAPIYAKDFSNQPDTLIITAEFDPLRDEGEAYGELLKEAGNYVEIHRIKDALHGYFALGLKYLHVQESYELINAFINKENDLK